MLQLAEAQTNHIERAIKVLRARGWVRGTLMDRSGRVCAMGALNVAYSGEVHIQCPMELVYYITDVMAAKTGYHISIQVYNDRYARSAEDVIDILQCAADRLRSTDSHNFYLAA